MSYCEYGSSPKPGQPDYVQITETMLVEAVPFAEDFPWLMEALDVAYTAALFLPEFCALVPDVPDPFDASDFLTGALLIQKALKHVRYWLWAQFCQCNNGQGACTDYVYSTGEHVVNGLVVAWHCAGGVGTLYDVHVKGPVAPDTWYYARGGIIYMYWTLPSTMGGQESGGNSTLRVYYQNMQCGIPVGPALMGWDANIDGSSALDITVTVCLSSGPPPTLPPAPVTPSLPGEIPTPTGTTCASLTDVCNYLDRINAGIGWLLRGLTPATYVQSGQFTLEGDQTHSLLADALQLGVAGIPLGTGQAGTTPTLYFGRHLDIGPGFLMLGNALGWRLPIGVQYEQQWIQPVPPDCDIIGSHLPPGVVVTVTEYVAQSPFGG